MTLQDFVTVTAAVNDVVDVLAKAVADVVNAALAGTKVLVSAVMIAVISMNVAHTAQVIDMAAGINEISRPSHDGRFFNS